MRIAVIGVGQTMRGDDAAGLEAVRMWQIAHPETAMRPDVAVELTENPGLGLLELLAGAGAAVVVDAVQCAAGVDSLACISAEDLDTFRDDSKSAHGWGVAETLLLGRALEAYDPRMEIRLIGIPAAEFDVGAGLSQGAMGALPRACAAIQTQVQQLLGL